MTNQARTSGMLVYKRNRFATRLPTDRFYTRSHYWLREVEPAVWRIGFTKFATRMLGDADAAADAVAEGLVRAYRHLASCREPARLKSWLYRIVGNRCRSHLARRSVSDVSLEDAPPLLDAADTAATMERAEQRALVERALADLSPEKREAFVLKHIEGMSYEEMSAVTGERIPALKMRVHRAREALLDALKEYT